MTRQPFKVARGFGLSIALGCFATINPAKAQIVPDNTLPVNSSVTPGCAACTIDGGTVRGTNLFHSFQSFSVPTGGEAYFNNDSQIQNILTRVTGNSVSNIDGLLRANGTANLFLLNPNGISFGANATLNLGGSFIASTASSLVFADGTAFSAKPDTSTPPLLTISVPLGLQFGGNPGKILVQGNGQGTRFTSDLFTSDLPDLIDIDFGLQVPSNQTLAIVGGDISLEGATLKTAGGRIELGSVAGSGFVSLTPIDKGWVLGYQGVSAFGDIQLSQQAAVDTSGLGGGDIAIWGRHLSLTGGSQIEASTLGTQPGGTFTVNVTDAVELIGASVDGQLYSVLGALVYPGAKGTGADLSIDTGQLIIRDGALVGTVTFGEGASGNVRVNATESVELVGSSSDGRQPSVLSSAVERGARGAGGKLSIDTKQLTVSDGAVVSTSVYPGGKGAGGELSIHTGRLIVRDGASVESATFGEGPAGELSIDTKRLIVLDGAVVSTATFGEGASGSLRVNATESVELLGRSSDGQSSGLFSSVQRGARGAGGELSIDTGRLIVRNGAVLSAGTLGEGQSGNLRVNATESVEVTGTGRDGFPSLLAARTRTAYNGGTLRVETGYLVVGDGAQITVSSTSSGKAGTLEVKADSIFLDNQASLQANTTGGGGNIFLTTPLLLLRRGSNITTNAQGNNIPGGNITIDAPNGFIVAVPKEDSDITANAFQGRGGNINITATGIYGIDFRPHLTPLSDITASSETGVDGIVDINTSGIDPVRGLANLPTEPVNTEVAQDCQTGGGKTTGSFINTGRGGLPTNPYEPLSSNDLLADVQPPTQWTSNSAGAASPSTSAQTNSNRIVEAQGWIINANGEVVLVAEVPSTSSQWGCRLR